MGPPWWLSGKESTCQCRHHGFNLWVEKVPWRRKLATIPVFLPGKSHGQKSLAGYSPWGCKRVGHDLTIEQQRKIIITDKTVNSQKVKKISYMNTLRGKL